MLISIPDNNSRYNIKWDKKERKISFFLSGATYGSSFNPKISRNIFFKKLYEAGFYSSIESISDFKITNDGKLIVAFKELERCSLIPLHKIQSSFNEIEKVNEDTELDLGFIPNIKEFKINIVNYLSYIKKENLNCYLSISFHKIWNDIYGTKITFHVNKEIANVRIAQYVIVNNDKNKKAEYVQIENFNTYENMREFFITKTLETILNRELE